MGDVDAEKTWLETLFQNDPLADCYNLRGLTDVILTCDVDWAPDFALEQVLQAVERSGHKITVFATHPSPLLQQAPDWVEVGLHPDLTRAFTFDQGAAKLAWLKETYPRAQGMRSHRNFFGQNVGDLAKAAGLRYDASTFLWNEPFCQAHRDYNGMARFSYFWEDGIHLDMGLPLDWQQVRLHTPGLKILNVHPILMYLNAPAESHRRAVTGRYRDLTQAPRRDLEADIYQGRGIRDVWLELLQALADGGVRTHQLAPLAVRAQAGR